MKKLCLLLAFLIVLLPLALSYDSALAVPHFDDPVGIRNYPNRFSLVIYGDDVADRGDVYYPTAIYGDEDDPWVVSVDIAEFGFTPHPYDFNELSIRIGLVKHNPGDQDPAYPLYTSMILRSYDYRIYDGWHRETGPSICRYHEPLHFDYMDCVQFAVEFRTSSSRIVEYYLIVRADHRSAS